MSTTPLDPHGQSDHSQAAAAGLDGHAEALAARASRQTLVVPPPRPPVPLAIVALAAAAAGFAAVFFLGIGRVKTPHTPAEIAIFEAEPIERTRPDVQPASYDAGQAAEGPAPGRFAERPLSRFSSPDLPPLSLEPVGPLDVGSAPEAGPPQAPALEAPPAAPAELPEQPPAEEPDEPEPEGAVPGSRVEPVAEPEPEPAAEPEPAVSPEPVAESKPEAVLEPTPAAAPEPTPAAAEPPPAAEPRQLSTPVTEPEVASAEPPAELPEPAPTELPPATLPTDLASERQLPLPASEPPAAVPVSGPPAASPFAAAPPVAPPVMPPPAVLSLPPAGLAGSAAPVGPAGPVLDYDAEVTAPGPSPLAAAAPPPGQGMPGPLQLEGIQTPQVAVEKQGPREIQVGKPARYEIVVRNVGTATAHDIVLRDAVPRGTSLIATTPPAAPAERPGDLVWTLGVLPPGGEARVIMELMPDSEGEIGSVASVSFRADASIRSRATRPALAIDCPPPAAVRIGGDIPVTLTISNPGTGVATGVVLEGFLPDTVSHRSGGELEFDVGKLRPGETKTIDLVLGTRGPGRQPLRLVARADGGVEADLAVPLDVIAPTLELAIDMPARRFLQRPATCMISMVNSGTAAARAVELAAQLPSGLKFVKANHAGWHDERTNRVLWNLEELPPGETGHVTLVVMPVDAGEQRIVAAARSTDGPSDQAVHVCRVEGLAALAFHVADSEDPIEVGGVTEYVVRVANEGTKAATGVQVAASLMGDLEPVEATGPGGHRIDNLAVAFEPLAKLGPGEEAVYRIRARGLEAGHQRIQVKLVSEEQPVPIVKEETTSVYDDR
jgi:uncharacterized repeat protein (TIGR01451 family)